MSNGIVNPNPAQRLVRDVARRKTLKAALEKNQARGNSKKVAEIESALEEITARINAFSDALKEV